MREFSARSHPARSPDSITTLAPDVTGPGDQTPTELTRDVLERPLVAPSALSDSITELQELRFIVEGSRDPVAFIGLLPTRSVGVLSGNSGLSVEALEGWVCATHADPFR